MKKYIIDQIERLKIINELQIKLGSKDFKEEIKINIKPLKEKLIK